MAMITRQGDNGPIYRRKSIRLKGYDYSQAGMYFITMCCQNRACLFGKIVLKGSGDVQQMMLNEAGNMVQSEWLKLAERFPNIVLHEFVVMPDHFHGILEILSPVAAATTVPATTVGATTVAATTVGATLVVAPNTAATRAATTGAATTKIIGDIIGAFKSITTVEYIRGVKNHGWKKFDGKLWQRDYYEHIIRKNGSYQRIAKYIINNPAKWKGRS